MAETSTERIGSRVNVRSYEMFASLNVAEEGDSIEDKLFAVQIDTDMVSSAVQNLPTISGILHATYRVCPYVHVVGGGHLNQDKLAAVLIYTKMLNLAVERTLSFRSQFAKMLRQMSRSTFAR